MIAKWIFMCGQQLRNPSLKSWLGFLKNTETWSSEQLEAYQLQKLKELVQHVYENSKFYQEKFVALGIHPSEIRTLSDIKKLPLVSKEELIHFNKEIHAKGIFEKTFQASTSGTSGESLKFKREESADSFNRASIFRGYSWYQVKPWERNGYFWGFNFSTLQKLKTSQLDTLQNRFRLFSYESKELFAFTRKLTQASYIHGYSSMIYETAKMVNRGDIQKPQQLKLVKGTSEKIMEAYQQEIIKAYGTKMISEYGAAETGIIAFECPQGNMHINMEGVIVEEMNHEIIVTNLQMQAFPIIRYKLGDYIKLAPRTKQCACGMKHQILEEVTGRIGSVVYGTLTNYPSLYFYYIFKNLAATHHLYLNYKAVQYEKGRLTMYIEQLLTKTELEVLKKEIEVYFKKDLKVEIKMGQKINEEYKKQQSFISKIS